MKHISTFQVMWTNKIIATWHLKVHKSSITVLSTEKDWQSGEGSQLLEFLALAYLKTTKGRTLLWHPSTMWQCYATSVNHSYVVVGPISHHNGFSKEQQPTQQGNQWVFYRKWFHKKSFPWRRCSTTGTFTSSLRTWLHYMGYHKSRVFISKPKTIVELNQSIK